LFFPSCGGIALRTSRELGPWYVTKDCPVRTCKANAHLKLLMNLRQTFEAVWMCVQTP